MKEEKQWEGLDENILTVYKPWQILNKKHKSFDFHLQS